VALVGYAAGTQRSITELEVVVVDADRDCESCRLRTRRRGRSARVFKLLDSLNGTYSPRGPLRLDQSGR
jgi:hypothetical protein